MSPSVNKYALAAISLALVIWIPADRARAQHHGGHGGGHGHIGGHGHVGGYGHGGHYGHLGHGSLHYNYGGHHGYYGGHHGYRHHYYHDYHYSPFYFGLYYWPWYGYYGYGLGGYDPWYEGYYGGWPYSSATIVYGRVRGPAFRERSSARSSGGPEAVAERGHRFRQAAEAAFRAGRYQDALRLADHAAIDRPADGKLQLFRAQILLAVGDYQRAAAALHRAMALLDVSDWGYVVENFRNYYHNSDYVNQIKALERFVAANPTQAASRFLLGYHYGFLGYPEQGRRELAEAVRLDAEDKLAARLLEHFGGPPAKASQLQDNAGRQAMGDSNR